MIKKNKQRRMEKLREEQRIEDEKKTKEDERLRKLLGPLFLCPQCGSMMTSQHQEWSCVNSRGINAVSI